MKKLLSIVLVIAVFVSMALPVGASTVKGYPKIYSIDDHAFGDYIGNAATRPEQTRPGDEIIIPMKQDGFRDINDSIIKGWNSSKTDLGPTVRQLKASKVVPKLHVVKGQQYIRDIQFVEFKPTDRIRSQSAIRVRFVEGIHSSAEITYEFSVYLQLDDTMTVAGEQFGGMVRNEIFDVTNRDYIYIGDGEIAKSYGDNKGLELDLGNGVSIFRDMFNGEMFYGSAELSLNDKQDLILENYPEITEVYDVKTVDVKFNGNVVKLTEKAEDLKLYNVYNVKGEFVGLSNQMLPYSTRYYLSVEEIEIDPAFDQSPELTQDESTMGAGLSRFVEGGKAQNEKADK